jgi:hypothetical protein
MIDRRLRHGGPGREAMSGDGSLPSIDDSARKSLIKIDVDDAG